MKTGNALLITLILVVVAMATGIITLKFFGKPAGVSSVVNNVLPTSTTLQIPITPTTAVLDKTNTGLDNQISEIQKGLILLDQDQADYVQIDQNVDNITP